MTLPMTPSTTPWVMPAETAPQDRVWMAFPPSGGYLGDTGPELDASRAAWAAVANAIVDFEPVTMVVNPGDRAAARAALSSAVELVEAPLNDAWMRDMGPTFVLGPNGELGAVDWVFNGWGAQDWARWDLDAEVGAFVGAASGAHVIDSALVNEGGGIAVDGQGTVLLTETVQLDPGRNPDLDKAAVEAELARTIGARHAVWLPRGLTRDAQRYGTRGHVDIVAAITAPGELLLHWQRDAAHPDYAVCREIREVLKASHDVAGRSWSITELPAPEALTDDEGFVDYSYVNHLVINGAVIGCSFADSGDADAAAIMGAAYPGREIVMVDARQIFAGGGGIHCITQHQPSALAASGVIGVEADSDSDSEAAA